MYITYRTLYLLSGVIFSASLFGCVSPDPQAIIDEAIAVHGGDLYRTATVDFDFRDRHFRAERDRWRFTFTRTMTDSLGLVKDVLTHKELYRSREGKRVLITREKALGIETGINGPIYFALLPYGLNGPAVHKKYLGNVTFRGEPYHKIEVTFEQQGGGRDWEDRFIYWIHQDQHTMDYLAYRFHVNDGGTRFREAYNVRTINGIRFADYHNFTHPNPSIDIATFDQLFEAGTLEKISDIDLKNITVEFPAR